MPAPPAIVFDHVSFIHASGHPALCDVTFSVPAGRTVAVVGRSGAGKSTLLRLVNRLLDPSSGEIRVEGRPTSGWDPIQLRRRIGYFLQEVGLFPHLTVAENLGLVPRIERWTAERIRRRVDELLDLVGLSPSAFRDRLPGELSGGQRQRVGVARALILDPPILLMDEPFGALDPVTRHQLHDEFWRIQLQLRRTVLIVTHDLREALELGEDLGVVDGGSLAAFGPCTQVMESSDARVRTLVETLTTVARHPAAGAPE